MRRGPPGTLETHIAGPWHTCRIARSLGIDRRYHNQGSIPCRLIPWLRHFAQQKRHVDRMKVKSSCQTYALEDVLQQGFDFVVFPKKANPQSRGRCIARLEWRKRPSLALHILAVRSVMRTRTCMLLWRSFTYDDVLASQRIPGSSVPPL